jgi:sugar O-acyltransferase (sialic acid O-acetyltransferase NeuD family)
MPTSNKLQKKVVIIGAGGFGREVLDIFDALNKKKNQFEVLGFIVQKQYGEAGTIVNGKPILGDFDWLESHHSQVEVTCSVGAPQQRSRLVRQVKEIGCKFINVIHPNAIMTRWITLGEGVIIAAGCILTNNIQVGNYVHLNLDCTVGHDVVMKDYVTLAPGIHVSGNIEIKEGCYIGTGANIIEKLKIGEWSVIGAGSTIVKDVSPNTTVVGVPGKVIRTRENGWQNNEK